MSQSSRRASARSLALLVALGLPAAGLAPAQAADSGAPTLDGSVSVVSQDDGTYLVSWEPATPASDEPGDAVAGYELDLNTLDDVPGETYVAAEEGSTYLTPELGEGSHQVGVTAVDVDGDRSETALSEPFEVEAAYQLADPTDVQATESAPGTVDVTWALPEVPEGAPALTWQEVSLVNVDPEASGASTSVEVDETSTTFEDVEPGTYQVIVFAEDADRNGSQGEAAEDLTVVGHVAPDAPTITYATQGYGTEDVEVEWQAPDDAHGFTVDSYTLSLRPSDGEPSPVTLPSRTVQVQEPDQFEFSSFLADVPAGTYDVVVTAHSDGEDVESVEQDVLVVALPDAVRDLKVVQVGQGKITVTWTAPEAGDATISGYGVMVPNSGAQMGGFDEVGPNTFSRTYSNLRPGRTPVTVVALTPYGEYTQPGAVAQKSIVVTNSVKTGAPTLKVKDAKLKRGQKLEVSGKAVKGSIVQLELKGTRSADYLVLGWTRATRSGTWSMKLAMPEAGTVRAVAAATGRVSGSTKVTITATGR